MSLFRLHGTDRRISPYCNTRVPIYLVEPMCVVISECATSVICVCGIDRRKRVCVLLLATPNTLVLYLDTLESAIGRTSGQQPSDT